MQASRLHCVPGVGVLSAGSCSISFIGKGVLLLVVFSDEEARLGRGGIASVGCFASSLATGLVGTGSEVASLALA